ncbi:MAG: amidohydrolase family protein [Planctomycetales bacterium]
MLTRRNLLQSSAVTALALAAAPHVPAALLADEAKLDLAAHPYIDAHSHLWSPDTARWPLANDKTKADLDPPSFTPEEVLRLAHPLKIGRVVAIQHHIYHGWDNTYLTDCAAQFPGVFSVVGMIDDRQPGAAAKMDALAKKRVRAFRITPMIYQEQWLASEGMTAMWKRGAQSGQAMCCLIDAKHLPEVDAMCKKHPQTNVVIDHFARIGVDGMVRDADVAALCQLARHPRVTVKLSAYYALGKKQPPYLDLVPMIRKVLDAFGPERCMWASDAPYQVQGEHTYPASFELLHKRLDSLSEGDKEWLLRKTAERVYFS